MYLALVLSLSIMYAVDGPAFASRVVERERPGAFAGTDEGGVFYVW